MPEVQSVGATDYQMPVVQPQNQYMEEPVADENIPMIYNPEDEVKRKAASSKLGLTLLGIAIAGGLGFWGGRSTGKKVNNAEFDKLKELVQNKYNEAEDAYSPYWLRKIESKTEFIKNFIEDMKPYVEDAEKAVDDAVKDTDKKPPRRPTHS